MLNLILAIICSSTIALVFKFSESSNLNRYAVTTVNYAAASAVSFFQVILSGVGFPNSDDFNSFFSQFSNVLKEAGSFDSSASKGWAVFLGLLMGVFFFLAFIFYQRSVRESGVGLSGAFSKLGIMLPVLLSMFLWGEYPFGFQWYGIALTVFAIIIINLPSLDAKFSSMNFKFSLFLLFIFGGLSEFSNKIYQKYGLADYKSLFLLCIFFSAFILSLITLFTSLKNKKPSFKELFTGIAVGVPNLFSSFFLIAALGTIKSSVAYPVYSLGSIILITFGGIIIFREKPEKKEILGIIISSVAIIFLSI